MTLIRQAFVNFIVVIVDVFLSRIRKCIFSVQVGILITLEIHTLRNHRYTMEKKPIYIYMAILRWSKLYMNPKNNH